MPRRTRILIFIMVMGLLVLGYSSTTRDQSLSYREVYLGFVGFSSSPEIGRERIPQDVYIFHDIDKWLEFKTKYLWSLNIPDPSNGEKFIVI